MLNTLIAYVKSLFWDDKNTEYFPQPELDKRTWALTGDDIYARKGELITCERGHIICAMQKTVKRGDPFIGDEFCDWQMKKPYRGQHPIPRCEKCGALWCLGLNFPFMQGWRV